ncbi:MAG: PucR family transcriptional regulator [Solobacterium sp.]|nr:PucR family transcriptional regulator [Solobacterium sp.]
MTLQDLINQHIFESYEVITKADLDKTVKKVSILETPDFDKYIFENSLILTTFYLIQRDRNLFTSLVDVMKEKQTAGIVISHTRFGDEIPQNIIETANDNDIPIILLHYEANLSSVFTSIHSELQTNVYNQHQFHTRFNECMDLIQKNPSPQILIDMAHDISGFDVVLYSYQEDKNYYTDSSLLPYLEDTNIQENILQKVNNYLVYKEEITFNDQHIYRIVLRSDNDNRQIIHTNIEVIKILLKQVHQRRTDLAMHLDQFLMNFVINFTSSYSTNQDIIEEGKIYNWHIEFPMLMILVTSRKTKKDLPNNGVIVNQLKSDIIKEYGIKFEEVKYISFQNKVTFLLNSKFNELISTEKVKNIINSDPVYDDYLFAVTKPIDDAGQLPIRYRQIMDASQYIIENNPDTFIIPPDFIDFYRIIKTMDKNDLSSLVNDLIRPLVEFEKNHDIPLIKTLLVYIQSHFNIKQASHYLYIHYNTLKYRLGIIKNLGYDINDTTYSFLPLYMSLYLYDIGLIQI